MSSEQIIFKKIMSDINFLPIDYEKFTQNENIHEMINDKYNVLMEQNITEDESILKTFIRQYLFMLINLTILNNHKPHNFQIK